MSENKVINLKDILNHPQVKKVTDDVNAATLERRNYSPPECDVFSNTYTVIEETDRYRFELDKEAEKQLPDIINNRVQLIKGQDSVDDAVARQYGKTRNIGIVFSGGPAPGGHNVIAGLYDAAKKVNPTSKVFGFLVGPDGIVENEVVELTDEMVDNYRNLGGFTMIKTGRTKIDTSEKMRLSRQTCRLLQLDALIVVGGDDSNTNAAFLAQELLPDGIQVIGVPKTIDGDIQVRDADGKVLCAMSFGFHTAARAFAGSISNLCTDSSSDVKYWHICKVMGRVASHLALEVALQTHANMTLIGEDLADYVDPDRYQKAQENNSLDYHAYGMTLRHLSRIICEAVVRRAAVGKNYGVIVIPEGVLEFINEIQVFILKLNTIIADHNRTHDRGFHSSFPRLEDKLEYLRRLAQRSREDSAFKLHGNFPFSQVETEKVLLGLVQDYLDILKEEGKYKVGIQKDYYSKILINGGLDPDRYGPAVFKNYGDGEYLLVKPDIISIKTLNQALQKKRLIAADDSIPAPVEKIFKKSMPSFKTQVHFYGYDGRGNDPTRFDCNYTYNLGLTVFSLIANGATGQMAAIKNLDLDFSRWEPIGIPIAPLMHLEERKSKLSLVIEKSIVDVSSIAFQVVKAHREKWLAAEPGNDHYRRPGPVRFAGNGEEERPITLELNAVGNSEA
jgi:pyrophosphate--fructose-6-phosphate 1-phosphotransferase